LGQGSALVLNLPTLADIMLGTVDNWNHSAIRELNPSLAAFLPNQSIIVVTPTGDADVMLLFTQALSGASTAFHDTVRNYYIGFVCSFLLT
jgi:ABC-type phosphate transport system substrate-binding protein